MCGGRKNQSKHVGNWLSPYDICTLKSQSHTSRNRKFPYIATKPTHHWYNIVYASVMVVKSTNHPTPASSSPPPPPVQSSNDFCIKLKLVLSASVGCDAQQHKLFNKLPKLVFFFSLFKLPFFEFYILITKKKDRNNHH